MHIVVTARDFSTVEPGHAALLRAAGHTVADHSALGLGAGADPAQVAARYTDYLAQSAFLLPEALECVRRWSAGVPVYLVTNGLSDVQRGRLERSALKPYIRDIIISQEVGAQKPDPRMLKAALHRAGDPDRREVLMLGDSLSSDIRGAVNAGIDSCYFNPRGTENTSGVTPTYEVRALHEVDALLKL